jgi:carbohydrate kinase (thermoresistant glucokinase family)
MAAAEPALPSVLVLMGVSGCGKSTVGKLLAKKLGWRYEEGDSFHPKSNVEKMHAGHPLTDEDRRPWLEAIAHEIDRVRAAEEHVVLTCSALKRRYRDIIIGARPDVRLVYLQGSRELIGARIAKRKDHFMPAALLDSQFAALEEPTADERALTVSVAPSPDEIVANIRSKLNH